MFLAYRLPRRTLLSASVAVGTTLSLPNADSKLSVYSSPTPDIVLIHNPSELEKQIGIVRRQAQGLYSNAHAYVQGWVSKWIGVEHAVENRIKSIISPDEPLTPGALYVGVATLSGSIIARNRILPTRLLLPPIFLIASAQHFLPKTTHNFSAYLGSLEDKYFPTVSQKHEIAKAHSAMAWQRVKEATQENRTRLEKVSSSAVDQVQKVTGLKIRESFGRGKARIDAVAAKVESDEKTESHEQLKMGDNEAKDSQGEEKKLE